MLTGARRCLFFKVCESIIAPLVYISCATAWDTWLHGSGPRSWARVLVIFLTKMAQSVCFGSDDSLLGRVFLHGGSPSLLVIREDRVQLSINVIVLPGKVRVVPLAVAVRLRTVARVAQNRMDFERLERTAVLFGWSADSCLGHVHLADTRRCNFLPSACTAAHVRASGCFQNLKAKSHFQIPLQAHGELPELNINQRRLDPWQVFKVSFQLGLRLWGSYLAKNQLRRPFFLKSAPLKWPHIPCSQSGLESDPLPVNFRVTPHQDEKLLFPLHNTSLA